MYSAVALLAAGAGILWFARHEAEVRSEREVVERAQTTALLLADRFEDPDFQGPVDAARRAELDHIFSHVLGGEVIRVKLWTPDGMISYSNDASLIGDRYPHEDVAAVLAGDTRSEIGGLNDDEGGAGENVKVLPAYAPVRTDSAGEPAGIGPDLCLIDQLPERDARIVAIACDDIAHPVAVGLDQPVVGGLDLLARPREGLGVAQRLAWIDRRDRGRVVSWRTLGVTDEHEHRHVLTQDHAAVFADAKDLRVPDVGGAQRVTPSVALDHALDEVPEHALVGEARVHGHALGLDVEQRDADRPVPVEPDLLPRFWIEQIDPERAAHLRVDTLELGKLVEPAQVGEHGSRIAGLGERRDVGRQQIRRSFDRQRCELLVRLTGPPALVLRVLQFFDRQSARRRMTGHESEQGCEGQTTVSRRHAPAFLIGMARP